MLLYIGKRVLLGISVMLTTLVLTFLIFFAGPSDPAASLCPENRCPQSKLEEIRSSMGLDRPLPAQFGEYFKGLFVGREIKDGGNVIECTAPCLGYSWRTHRDVRTEVFSRLPNTAMLAFMTMGVFLVVGLTLGVYSARRRGTPTDRAIVGVSQVFGAIPYYVLALLFALNFVIFTSIFPRYAAREDGLGPWLAGLIAPALILGLVYATTYVRYTRAQMIETLAQDYVRTARSKGIGEQTVVYKHALRAALTPVVTLVGLDMAGLLSGTLVTEKIFGVDGIGKLAIESFRFDDLPTIMGTVLVGAFFVVVLNLVVDIVYSFLDPRVRLS